MNRRTSRLVLHAFLFIALLIGVSGDYILSEAKYAAKADNIPDQNVTESREHHQLSKKSSYSIHNLELNVYLPIITKSIPKGIYGTVTFNGVPAPNVNLHLRFYDGTSWSTKATGVTNANGEYSFLGMTRLQPGQLYYVLFLNELGYLQWLYYWQTREIDNYDGFSDVNIGNFDIAELNLTEPEPLRQVSFPITFKWYRRFEFPLQQTPIDSYELHIYYWSTYQPSYVSGPLGYVYSYTLETIPEGFSYNYWYVWDINIYSEDGGSGVSNDFHEILFIKNLTDILDIGLPIHPQRIPFREIK